MKYLLICFISFLGLAQDFNALNSTTVLDYFSAQQSFLPQSSTIVQMGNSNEVWINSGYDFMKINQIGHFNELRVHHESYKSSSLQIQMIGQSNEIQIFGMNGMSRQMSIDIIGNDRKIYMTNSR